MNFEPVLFFGGNGLSERKNSILATNEKSVKYGLTLTESDAAMLVEANISSLKERDRVEFGESISVRLAEKFMKSSYICQKDYADTLAALTDIFYEAKDESCDLLGDDEIINIMFAFFEKESGGSLDVLRNRDMDSLCRKIKYRACGILEEDK